MMKTTRYFEEQVLRKRAYLKRNWIYVPELGKHLRIVTLEDGETVHNAFPDRGFKERES
jgi:hypothetical protein